MAINDVSTLFASFGIFLETREGRRERAPSLAAGSACQMCHDAKFAGRPLSDVLTPKHSACFAMRIPTARTFSPSPRATRRPLLPAQLQRDPKHCPWRRALCTASETWRWTSRVDFGFATIEFEGPATAVVFNRSKLTCSRSFRPLSRSCRRRSPVLAASALSRKATGSGMTPGMFLASIPTCEYGVGVQLDVKDWFRSRGRSSSAAEKRGEASWLVA